MAYAGVPGAIAYLQRRQDDEGKTRSEAIRALKRRLSDVIYRALLVDAGLAPQIRLQEASLT